MGEPVSFLHAIDGTVLPLLEQAQGGEESTSINLLDIAFVVAVIQSFAQHNCTLEVAPVSLVRHAAHWFKPGVWCVMTNPNRMVLMSGIVQLDGMIRSDTGSSLHVTGLTFVKLYSFTFEELCVTHTPSTISFHLSCLAQTLNSLQHGHGDVLSPGIDSFPCPQVEQQCPSARWAWSGHNLMQLMTDEGMSFQPLHYLGEHESQLGDIEGSGDYVMEFKYR